MSEMSRTSLGLLVLLMGLALVAGNARRMDGGPYDASEVDPSSTEAPERANRLVHESSPYLRLHAYNPVDWYPWGQEALSRARREDKPIFLSIGYSTCYWCHVMEREVFENPELAALMNEWFINIKVDREERPELDEIYMTATQLLTRRGGWPNSVFLTPDLEPFFAGTYFPPEDKNGRPGFRRILEALHRYWLTDRTRVIEESKRVAQAIRETLAEKESAPEELPTRESAQAAIEQLSGVFDEANGGFAGAPKFPTPSNLYLLWERARSGDDRSREMVVRTLEQMGRGAIYDQLDGGFHRYTLDAQWRIPHFEKMLYDNAHLAELLSIVAAETGNAELERLARGTFDFVLQWMRLPNGAFKSAIDAETDAVEGAYYIWRQSEVLEIVGADGFELLGPLFGLDGEPNFEDDHYTLYLPRPYEALAEELDLSPEAYFARLEPYLARLRAARLKREFPLVDDKVLTDWNGMMIAALARGGELLGEPAYVDAASRAAQFLLTLRSEDGTLLHTWRDGVGKIPALLDDYAYLGKGLLALHDVTGANRWLAEAIRLQEELELRLRAPVGGYYMSTARPDLLIQVVSPSDGAIPSGNGIAVLNLIELARRTGRPEYRERANAALRVFSPDLEAYPRAVTTLALATLRLPPQAATSQAPRPSNASAGGAGGLNSLAREVVTLGGRFDSATNSEQGWLSFLLEIVIAPGWHVNANPASLEFLIPTQIEGDTRKVRYPEGEAFRFEFAPEEIKVYSGEITLGGEIPSTQTALRVTYQACDDRRCLPPVTETVALE